MERQEKKGHPFLHRVASFIIFLSLTISPMEWVIPRAEAIPLVVPLVVDMVIGAAWDGIEKYGKGYLGEEVWDNGLKQILKPVITRFPKLLEKGRASADASILANKALRENTTLQQEIVARFNQLDEKSKAVVKRVASLEARLDVIEAEYDLVKARLSRLERKQGLSPLEEFERNDVPIDKNKKSFKSLSDRALTFLPMSGKLKELETTKPSQSLFREKKSEPEAEKPKEPQPFGGLDWGRSGTESFFSTTEKSEPQVEKPKDPEPFEGFDWYETRKPFYFEKESKSETDPSKELKSLNDWLTEYRENKRDSELETQRTSIFSKQNDPVARKAIQGWFFGKSLPTHSDFNEK